MFPFKEDKIFLLCEKNKKKSIRGYFFHVTTIVSRCNHVLHCHIESTRHCLWKWS